MDNEPDEIIGDIDIDDAYNVDDHRVDWDNIVELASKYDDVLAVEDDDERLAKAKALVAEMDGE